MATQKPISTVSYNTEAFLREKLNTWIEEHIIQAYMYICHKGEDGDKDHIHLRIEPNKKLDPMDLSEKLKEYDPKKPDKPLCVRPWRPSKEEDWILYVVHDPQYLKLKYGGGEKGEKLPYSWQDIKANDNYDVEIAYIRAKAYMEHTSVNMMTKLQSGTSPVELVLTGENPFMVNAMMRTLSGNDYQRMQQEYGKLYQQLESLKQAVSDYGLVIVSDNDGNLVLEPFDDPDGRFKK